MEYLVESSIGIGLVLSLIFSEGLGLAAGGMVVPGYVALNLTDPVKVGVTILVALATWGVVTLMGRFMLIYGRRRTVIMIIVGFLFGILVRDVLSAGKSEIMGMLSIIGYIIPGLIAIWMDRQGIVETLTTLIISSTMVRFALIVVTGGEVF